MRNRIKMIINNSLFRRIISFLIVILMVTNIFPLEIISDYLTESEIFSFNASAVDPASPPDGYPYAHDANNAITLRITDFINIVKVTKPITPIIKMIR